jgi:hypothetical protein
MITISRIASLVAILFAICSHAPAQDEQPGTVVTYQLDTSYCGPTGGEYNHIYPEFNCYGIRFSTPGQPAGSAGSTWVYTSVYYKNPPGGYIPYGWGFFFGPSDLAGAEYTVTSSSYSVDPTNPKVFQDHIGFPVTPYVCANNCTTFMATIVGTTPDDGGSYTAILTADLYFYRAGRYNTQGVLVTGGTLQITYQ